MSAFPADLPPDLDDPTAIQQHDWAAFRSLGYLENHWDRPGWTPGRRSYHWMLSFHDSDEVQHLAQQCQAQLAFPALDLVPLDAVHLTLGRIGFTDDVDSTAVHEVVSAATWRCQQLAAFDLVIGPVAGSSGAIRFSVAPWSPLMALHRALSGAAQAVLGQRSAMDTASFRPHLSIAYANTTQPIPPLLPRLNSLRTLPTTTVTIASTLLVELRREGRAYRYQRVARIELRPE
ncbi:MAG: 2'-5' RNA ligase family protein [Sciscionella sp.]